MADIDFPDVALPTLPLLNVRNLSPETKLDVHKIASEWFNKFSVGIANNDVHQITDLILSDEHVAGGVIQSFWRDILSLTWDFRTFRGKDFIAQFLTDRLPLMHMSSLTLDEHTLPPTLQWPYPDLVWIRLSFKFETDVGIGLGIVRLVPSVASDDGNEIIWKAHVILTNLEDLKGFPEKIGQLRNQQPNHGKWEKEREKERRFEGKDPTVLIIGGGHNGLHLSARLKMLGVSSLVVEKNERIGDKWRKTYDTLSLNSPYYYDHFPYMPYPPTWPTFAAAAKLANWLEYYADSMELNVWTSTTVTHAAQDTNDKWRVTVKRSDGKTRTLDVHHLVFATGFGGGIPAKYDFPGLENFKGSCLHSTQYRCPSGFSGKKVAVVGACTSGHDISEDLCKHGADVTMIQRGPTYVMSSNHGLDVLFRSTYGENTGNPTDAADRISASFPTWMAVDLYRRRTKTIAELDKDLLDGLRKVGFKVGDGIGGTGFPILSSTKVGGYYVDIGASILIIEGKIKLKNDSAIKRITEDGIEFEDGSHLSADVIIFAIGFGGTIEKIREVCGDEVASKTKEIWGLDKEGEIRGAWRDLGLRNMWYITGNFGQGRFHSKHVALQIKAIEEGIFSSRYSLRE